MEVIDAAGSAPLIDEAARIWAEATAARDGRDEVPGLEDLRPVIQSVLDRSERSFLLIARSADGPRLWGQGVGRAVLSETCGRLQAERYASVELRVYLNNHRATVLYERAGWQAVGQPTPHPRTGKPEQRYKLHL